jgi:hypothetical protein
LLQFYTVCHDFSDAPQMGLDRNPTSLKITVQERQNVLDQRIRVERNSFAIAFLEHRADCVHDVVSSRAVGYTVQRQAFFFEFGRLLSKPSLGGLRIGHYGCNRLLNFVRNRRGEMSYCRHAVRMRQFHLHLAISSSRRNDRSPRHAARQRVCAKTGGRCASEIELVRRFELDGPLKRFILDNLSMLGAYYAIAQPNAVHPRRQR